MDSPTLPGSPPSLPGRLWHRVRWWWRGRDWRTFARAFPAVAAGVGVLALVVACAGQSPRELQARYLAEGKAAYQAKDYPRAITCYERVAPTADDPDAYYRLALTADATGDHARALTLMLGLAPRGQTGYAPAHYWIARQILAASTAARDVAAAKGHLVQALAGDLGADAPAAHGLLGKLYLAEGAGRYDDAERHLTQAAPAVPLVRLDLARLYAARGNPARARQEAELAARFFRDRAKGDLNNHAARLAWADATATLEDFPGAAAILEEGHAATRNPIYPAALAKVYVGWHDLRKKQAAPPGDLLALLDKGLRHDPASPDLLNRLLDHLRIGGAGAEKARSALRALLAKGTAAAAHVHFALAVDARLRNDPPAEKLHLEMALAADPKAGTVANNLAFLLSQPPNPDLPRALATADVALSREPTNPNFLDTRGRIRLAMGDWKGAAADLEAVLARAPNAEGVHAALATVYENLGQKEQAAEYRRQAEALRKPPAKP